MKKPLLLIILSLFFKLSYAPCGVYHPDKETLKNWLILNKYDNDPLLQAISLVESANRDSAYNLKENAAGRLQIRPIMVNEANRLAGYAKYTLSDRWSLAKSVEIWYTIQGRYNPEYNARKACYLWNGGAIRRKPGSHKYYIKVLKNIKKHD